MEQNMTSFKDYIDVVKRRKRALFVPVFLTGLAACVIAFTLPPVYKSTSTILIEDQEVPEDYVTSSVSTYAEKRIQNIKQRITSTAQLIEIIETVGLYQEMKQKRTTGDIVKRMRGDISVEPISAEVVDRRTGRSKTATIAFSISYEGKDRPEAIHEVATILTTLFLKENVKVRERQARETSSFLEDEKNRLKAYLVRTDSKIASFKEKHLNELPEVLQVNVQVLGDIERNIEKLNEEFRRLREREGYLEVNIAGLTSAEESDNQKRLNELKHQLAQLKTTYSDLYPDVIKVRNELAKLKKRIEGAEHSGRVLHNNSSYVVLASQLSSIRNDIKSVKIQIGDLETQKKEYQRRIQATPRVEEEYLTLVSERRSVQKKYDDLTMKAMEAKVAQGLEKEQKGEKFTLIEPALLPEKPYRPNRLAVILIGLVLGIGTGIGMGALMEMTDHSVRTAEDLARISGFPVLSEIPVIVSSLDQKRFRARKLILINGSLALIAVAIGAFSWFFVDFEVVWAAFVTKFQG